MTRFLRQVSPMIGAVVLPFAGLLYSSQAEALVADLTASRTACTSPCTIVFSAQTTTDDSLPNQHEVFRKILYDFAFDDPDSGVHETTGLPQQTQSGGPLATHTFICNAGTCRYSVAVTARNGSGEVSEDSIEVTVESPEVAYAAADTICVSPSGSFTGDEPCPAGAIEQTFMPALSEFSQKRVLFRRGEVIPGELCIGYGDKNVLVASFGDTADAKPELTGTIHVGVDATCQRPSNVTTAQARAFGDRWSENITISDLRVPAVVMGMSYHNVGLHDLDMDYFSEPTGGFITMASSGDRCVGQSSLDCDAVPYPYGLYMSELTVVTSDADAVGGTGGSDGVTIAGYSCPLINWLGLIGSTFWNAYQHQFRLEGGQRLSLSHNNMRGHTKGPSKKHTATLRSCGYSDIDIAERPRHDVNQGRPGAPWTRWAVFADNIHGSEDATNPSFKLHIAPTNAIANETIVDAIVERSTFVTGLQPSIDLALNGYYLTARTDNVYTPERQDCKDIGPASNPVHGEIDCEGGVPPLP